MNKLFRATSIDANDTEGGEAVCYIVSVDMTEAAQLLDAQNCQTKTDTDGMVDYRATSLTCMPYTVLSAN